MSADPDTGEIGRLLAGWPDPDGLTDEERWGRLPPKLQAELEELQRRLNEKMERASEGTYYRGGHALVFLLGMVAAAEDGAIGRAEAAVRGALVDLAAAGDELAAAALTPAGGPIRDRLARAALPLVGELWAELERRTGEALEAQGVPWAPVVGRILAGERGQRESDREREREAGWPVAEVEIEPAPGLSYEQAAANDREDRGTVAALGELRVPDPGHPDAPELLAWDVWLAERLAEWLRAGGPPTLAGEVLEAARTRAAEVAEEQAPPGDLWKLWAPRWGDPTPYGSLPVLATLAELAWPRLRAELGRERVARESLERWHAGLVPLVHASLGDALARAPRAALADLPLLPVGALQALHELNAQALGTVHGHRLVRWLIRKANEGWHLGEWGPVELWPGVWAQRETVGVGITIDGGLTGLAAALGDSSKQAPERYREVLLILGRHALSWQYGEKFGAGSMVTVEGLEPKPGAAGRGRRAELRIVVNPPLTPMVAPKLPDPYRWLVPVLPLPKLRGGKADQALARLDWAATRALVELMPEVAEHGGATLPWDRMARDEGVTRESLVWALGTWHPERWERLPGPGSRYMLAKGGDTGAARDFLLRGALRFKNGQKGGEMSAAKAAELEAGTPKRRRTKKPRRES